jgi:hypothetical protein
MLNMEFYNVNVAEGLHSRSLTVVRVVLFMRSWDNLAWLVLIFTSGRPFSFRRFVVATHVMTKMTDKVVTNEERIKKFGRESDEKGI